MRSGYENKTPSGYEDKTQSGSGLLFVQIKLKSFHLMRQNFAAIFHLMWMGWEIMKSCYFQIILSFKK